MEAEKFFAPKQKILLNKVGNLRKITVSMGKKVKKQADPIWKEMADEYAEAEEMTASEAAFAVGGQLEGHVVDVAFGGEGVVRHENCVFFIHGVISGEKIVFEIVELKKNFGRGRLIEVIEPSPDRVSPKCPLFGECGGCQYQHMNYPSQLAMKHKQVRDIFERIGGLDGNCVEELLACPQPYNYRNRIMVRTQWNRDQKQMVVGFLRHHSRLVVQVDECHIAENELNTQLKEVATNPSRKNGIKYVLRKFPDGWTLPNDSFFQNNFFLLPGMVGEVRKCLRSFGGEYLVDAYCGVGFFALELAGEVKSFRGVEIDRMAIRAARKNAESRGITNGEFVEGATEDRLPEIMNDFPPHATTVVLDPPRRGIDASAVNFLKSVAPGQILYVSCHPATQARDLAQFCADGQYRIEKIKPMDMFPQTQHVECVADLRLVQPDGSVG